MVINLFSLVHINLLHELTDNFRCHSQDYGVLPCQGEEVVYVERRFLIRRNGCPQFSYLLLKGILRRLVVGGHLGKTLIAGFTFEIVLVEPFDDFVQFADALCVLLQFTLVIPQALVQSHLGLFRDHFHKFSIVVFGKGGNLANIVKQSLLDDHIADLVGTHP